MAGKDTVNDGVCTDSGMSFHLAETEFLTTLVVALHLAVWAGRRVSSLNRASQSSVAIRTSPFGEATTVEMIGEFRAGLTVNSLPITAIKHAFHLARLHKLDDERVHGKQGHWLRASRTLIDVRRKAMVADKVTAAGCTGVFLNRTDFADGAEGEHGIVFIQERHSRKAEVRRKRRR